MKRYFCSFPTPILIKTLGHFRFVVGLLLSKGLHHSSLKLNTFWFLRGRVARAGALVQSLWNLQTPAQQWQLKGLMIAQLSELVEHSFSSGDIQIRLSRFEQPFVFF